MKIITAILLLLINSTLSAETLSTPDKTKRLCKNAVVLLAEEKISQSFEILKPFWPLPEAELDNLAYQTQSQLKMVANRIGKPIGTDFIKTQKAGSSFLKHTYIVKYEKHALRYMCLFYKPKNTWLINSVLWDDKTPLLFK